MTQKLEKQQQEFKFINSLYTRVLKSDQSLEEDKPKLVFLHGLLGNGQNWLPIARELEKNFTILLIDQRGHGKSFHPEDYHPKDFSDDLKSILDELNWKKVHLVGHSLGARVGFDFASKHPERLHSFVIEDMGPHKTDESSEGTKVMIESVPVPFETREEARAFFESSFKPKYGAVLSGYLYANIERKKNKSFDWRFSLKGVLECIKIGQLEDFWSEYEAVNVKSLVIRGERSGHLPLNIYKEMLDRNSNVQGVEIQGAGHWVHFEQKDLFVKNLKDFLLS